ncbi:MAG: hypothetical protein U1F77_17640 [Kiritimatiellia bacterium]
MKTLVAALLVGGMLVSSGRAKDREAHPPQWTEQDTLARLTRVDKSVEYRPMDQAEFLELQKQCQRSAALFPKAVELAGKDWAADGAHAGRPFPAGRLTPLKLELVDRLGPANRVKATKSSKQEGPVISKETADRTYIMPKKWEALLNKNGEVKEAKTAAEKQANADVDKAADLVMEKLRVLEEANPPAGKAAPAAKK